MQRQKTSLGCFIYRIILVIVAKIQKVNYSNHSVESSGLSKVNVDVSRNSS